MTHKPTAWGADPNVPFDHSHYNAIVITPLSRHRLQFTGKCPYCSGDVKYAANLKLAAVEPDAVVAQGAGDVLVDIECTCPEAHAGRPPGRTGCGQTWGITVEMVA